MPYQTLLLNCFLLLGACVCGFADDAIAPLDPMLGRPVEFYTDVHPILQAKCLACHSTAVAENELVLETAESILKGGASGAGVVPGKPEESYMYLVSTRGDEPAMPPLPNKAQAKSLTPRELGILKQWIQEGAQGGTMPTDADLAWQPIPETYKAVYSLEVSPHQRYIYAGRGNRIFVYDMLTKQEVTRLTDPALVAIQKEGLPLYGGGVAHRDFVHSLALSPDGKLLASGGYRIVKLWEKSAPEKLNELDLTTKIRTGAVSSNGTWAAFVLEDNSVKLWNLINGSLGPAINAGEQKVQAIAFAADSETVVTATETGIVKVWNLGDGKQLSETNTAKPITHLAVRKTGPQLITAHDDNILRAWAWPVADSVGEVQPVQQYSGHTQAITALTVLSNDTELLTGSRDATVKLWNLDNGTQLFNQNLGGVVTAAVASVDYAWIAATGENNVATIWNRAGQKIKDVSGSQQLAQAILDRTDDETVAKSQLAIADKAQVDMEADIKQREESLQKAKEQVEKSKKEAEEALKKANEEKTKADEAATKLAEKPDDEALKKAKEAVDLELVKQNDLAKKAQDALTSAERAVKLSEVSITTAKETLEIRKAEKLAAEETMKLATEALASAKDLSSKSVRVMQHATTSPSGITFLSAGLDQAVQEWSLSTGQALGALDLPLENLAFLTTTANGVLLSVNETGVARVWDISPKWSLVGTLGTDGSDISLSKFTDRITALAFSPDGNSLAVGGGEPSRNGEISIWNMADRSLLQEIKEPHSDTVFDIQFSRDGTRIVSGGADKFVKMFRLSDGTLVRSYEGHTDHVLGVSFQADGSSLASAGSDFDIKIWNTETGEQRRTIKNYSKQVTAIRFLGVTEKLISCSGDKTVKFHTAGNGANYRGFAGSEDFVYSVYAAQDESLVVAAGEDGTIRVWDGAKGNVLMTFPSPQPHAETAQK